VASFTKSVAIGITSASATARLFGGNGGIAEGTGIGGDGASARQTNAVWGSTQGGNLMLTQSDYGGNGGAGEHEAGGDGGNAASLLNLDDLLQPVASQSKIIDATANAHGGAGGGDLGSAGAANANIDITGGAAGQVIASANAFGGSGGAISYLAPGSGAAGASATSTAAASGGNVAALAGSYGGNGGIGDGPGFAGGTGGVATAAATASGLLNVGAGAVVVGGNGGTGDNAADGGAGASENLSNAVGVTGPVNQLTYLNEAAIGGNGGATYLGIGGDGGDADAAVNATFTDNADLSIGVTATGGDGGSGNSGAGLAGNASASSDVSGTGFLLNGVFAQSGETHGSVAGAATATASSTGTLIHSTARADSAGDPTQGGTAIATDSGTDTGNLTGHPQAGYLSAEATSGPGYSASHLVISGDAVAQVGVYQTNGQAQAEVTQGNEGAGFTTSLSSVTAAVLAPAVNAAPVAQDFVANPVIAAAFGADPTLFAVGEIGGAPQASSSAWESSNGTFTVQINPSQLPSSGELVLGLFGGQSFGSNVNAVYFSASTGPNGQGSTFTLNYAGPDAGAQAAASFTDNAIDLAPLFNSAEVTEYGLDITLIVSTDGLNSGFFGGFVLGDAPTENAIAYGMPHYAMAESNSPPVLDGLFHI
jgi:hypothetical protein